MKLILTFSAERFTGLHSSGGAAYAGEEDSMARTLLDKVWEAHTVRILPSGQTQLLIGLHLIHEVTTPQAFQMLKELKLKVRMPERTYGTLDHIIPTTDQTRPYRSEEHTSELQSHSDLVCRLLLEKKKDRSPTT